MTGMIKPMKNPNEPIRNRTRILPDYGVVPQTTALPLINSTIGKEITYSCATEIIIAVFTGPPIASVLRSKPAGHNFIFIYLRSILLLSSLLRILPPSGVLCCRYSGKGLFAYFLTVMRATVPPISSSIQTSVRLDTLVIG